MQNYDTAAAYVAALTQCDPSTATIDVRAIHDRDDGVPARPRRGTLPELWQWICEQNNAGFGIFCNIATMDGNGLLACNVQAVRCQAVDLDNIDAPQHYARLAASAVPPAFAVQSSPNKFHVYWHVTPHTDMARFTTIQRKLAREYNGDPRICDPARVLRLPGTYHHKGEPHLITCWALPSYGQPTSLDVLDVLLAHVDVSTSGHGGRHPLGTPELAAPSLDWVRHALAEIDPNDLDRSEWLTLIAATKQAGWSLADEPELFGVVSQWCARYAADNPAENKKQWTSIRDTAAGWTALVKRAPNTRVAGLLGRHSRAPGAVVAPVAVMPASEPRGPLAVPPMPDDVLPPDGVPVPPVPPQEAPADTIADEILTGEQCAGYFEGCIYVVSLGKMRIPSNRLIGPQEFNTYYGGKKFVIDTVGKVTDEAWKAATRSTIKGARAEMVDHLRFVPSEPWGARLDDALGRRGLNIYYPIKARAEPGDVAPFLHHLAMLIPNDNDRRILLEYMAHNIKYPGHKIPWAPVIQSGQGAGKSILKEVMRWGIGSLYTHIPQAKELVDSGSKFNGWLQHKLFICVDEIRVDERRELVEVLKPLISDPQIEMQKKGENQEVQDNYANWIFFTNFKDAVPVDKDSRRFSVFYSAVQNAGDLDRLGMPKAYFDYLWAWLETGGYRYVTQWLLDYPIERGKIDMRSPWTSSMNEAFRQTRSPLEKIILDAIDDGISGFRGGYVSVTAVLQRVKQVGAGMRAPSGKAVAGLLDGMGYKHLGRAVNLVFAEDAYNRPDIYAADAALPVEAYATVQGYR